MIIRSLIVFFNLLPFVLSFLRDQRKFIFFGSPLIVTKAAHLKRAKKLTAKIAHLGPTFIKLTQILSSRADLLPEIYLNQLSTLQDKVPPLETKKIIKVVENEFNKPIGEIFEKFSDESIAAASLGQVHRATFKGEDVVVKVLRPGVEELISVDISILMIIINFLLRVFPTHEINILSTIVREFSKIIKEEMNFSREAENVLRFQKNFAGNENIIIPDVYMELNTKRVLVLKYYKGIKIDQIEELTRINLDIKKILENLIIIYSQQVLIDGFFHADPHPGNIFVNQEGKIILLDFGMVIAIDEETKRELVKTAIAGANRNFDGLMEGLSMLGIIGPEINLTVLKDAAEMMMNIFDKKKISKKRIKELSNEIFNTFYHFPLNLPSNLVYLFKTAILIEGIGMKYDPDFNGIKDGTPIVKKMFGKALKEPPVEIMDFVFSKFRDLYKLTQNLEKVMRLAGREQFRVRLHPVDIAWLEGIFSYMFRRVLVSITATSIALVGAILYLRIESIWLLLISFGLAGFLLLVTFALPARRVFNPAEWHRKRVERDIEEKFPFVS
ncbi:MAG: hypothetical protein A2149_02180 [Candidatus Schekmanbacteria bacterium RBG_16_38_11]|uniref:Protein kinase domain-containing protein n=1 Tax=Candidatus Schekmanbacteria bacterium RBG_16_38_11 TaxID=1817880 RepID=A0A1F7RW60_9BACT|nr:MAG: hypothetical protein A2149_02180 [Candidatus Schekmanbacteria bacterium RBG_16_38_11]